MAAHRRRVAGPRRHGVNLVDELSTADFLGIKMRVVPETADETSLVRSRPVPDPGAGHPSRPGRPGARPRSVGNPLDMAAPGQGTSLAKHHLTSARIESTVMPHKRTGRRLDLPSGVIPEEGIPCADVSAATSILVIGLLAIGGLASTTLAQDATSTTAESPIVGAWLLDVGNDPGSPPTTGIFHADGTYIQTDGVGTGIGSWAATGPSSGDLTFTAYGPDETGALWSTTIRGSLEILADDTLSGTFSLEYVGPDEHPDRPVRSRHRDGDAHRGRAHGVGPDPHGSRAEPRLVASSLIQPSSGPTDSGRSSAKVPAWARSLSSPCQRLGPRIIGGGGGSYSG